MFLIKTKGFQRFYLYWWSLNLTLFLLYQLEIVSFYAPGKHITNQTGRLLDILFQNFLYVFRPILFRTSQKIRFSFFNRRSKWPPQIIFLLKDTSRTRSMNINFLMKFLKHNHFLRKLVVVNKIYAHLTFILLNKKCKWMMLIILDRVIFTMYLPKLNKFINFSGMLTPHQSPWICISKVCRY